MITLPWISKLHRLQVTFRTGQWSGLRWFKGESTGNPGFPRNLLVGGSYKLSLTPIHCTGNNHGFPYVFLAYIVIVARSCHSQWLISHFDISYWLVVLGTICFFFVLMSDGDSSIIWIFKYCYFFLDRILARFPGDGFHGLTIVTSNILYQVQSYFRRMLSIFSCFKFTIRK